MAIDCTHVEIAEECNCCTGYGFDCVQILGGCLSIYEDFVLVFIINGISLSRSFQCFSDINFNQ